MMLEQINFVEDYRCFKAGTVLNFSEPITLLVGDQGTGKSTLLHTIQMKKGDNPPIRMKIEKNRKYKYLFFDTEKMNPRVKSHITNDNVMFQVASMFASHGETMLPILKSLVDAKDSLILIDEPETGLSIRSQHKLVNVFRKAVENGCQIIMATHSVILMESVGRVFNITAREYQTDFYYIKWEMEQANA